MTTITFSEIPDNWRVPGTYTEIRPNYRDMGLVDYPTRVLLVGQKLAAGTAAAGTVYPLVRKGQAATLFGLGSLASEMAEAFLAANSSTDVDIIALADASASTKATGSIALTGTATAAGTIAAYVGGRRVTATVAAGATAAAAATALAAAITADTAMAVTAAAATATVTLTAKHGGLVGNDIDLRLNRFADESLPAGLSATVTAMSGGAGTPAIADVLAAISTTRHTDIVIPWTDSATLAVLTPELAARYTAMGRRDMHAWGAKAGTSGALAAHGAVLNDAHLTLIGAYRSPSSPWCWAAALAGVAVFHLTNDPARQLRSLVLPGILPPDAVDAWSPTEADNLLRDGYSTWLRTDDGAVVLERVITTYQRSTLGIEDPAWLDVMVPRVMTRIRYDWSSYVGLTWPRAKLVDDGSLAAVHDPEAVTPGRLDGAWAARCQLYGRRGWIENIEAMLLQSTHVRDDSDRNRVNSRKRVQIVGNLMVLAERIEFQA